MNGLIVHEAPTTKLKTMVVAFAGWPDAAEAATRAIRYMVRKLSTTKIVEIDPEEYYDFTVNRPQTRVNRQKERKILMVISDGAPVDDSTLSVNSGDFLEKHLKKTVKFIEEKSDIEILAIGIGHDVSRYYTKAIKITDVQELGDVMIGELSGLFENRRKLN